jgi:FkbM family methyltransferase
MTLASLCANAIGLAKRAMHRLIGYFGLELHSSKKLAAARVAEKARLDRQKWRPLWNHEFATILDIGANEGQFAHEIRRECPRALVYSFEPLPDVFSRLQANVANDDRIVPVNIGLGEHSGAMPMHRSDLSPSSSLLPMADAHRQEWPKSAHFEVVEVGIERLDDWVARSGATLRRDLLVKLDVQGFELSVIRGGRETLRKARMVIAEVSFEELYEGQPLFAEVHAELCSMGFRYRGNLEQHCSRRSNRILYADAIFENTNMRDLDV